MSELPDDSGALRIDIVSDVVCPWCIIGYKQLEQALAETGVVAEIHWHSFELNPHMTEEGENLRDHLAAKYGTSEEDSIHNRARLTALGKELGFTFNYADDMRTHNTFRAHRLLHWADELGLAHDLKMALFAAFFTDRRNINDPKELVDIAGGVGLDAEQAAAVLAEDRFAQEVRGMQQFWYSKGVRGVPAMVFKLEHLLVGAQGVANYKAILSELVGHRALGVAGIGG